jgi:hypothetical protein
LNNTGYVSNALTVGGIAMLAKTPARKGKPNRNRKERETSMRRLKREDFTYRATANGYWLQYKGKEIGGAGVKLPRETPLRGRQVEANRKFFSEQAQISIRMKIDAGRLDG